MSVPEKMHVLVVAVQVCVLSNLHCAHHNNTHVHPQHALFAAMCCRRPFETSTAAAATPEVSSGARPGGSAEVAEEEAAAAALVCSQWIHKGNSHVSNAVELDNNAV
jgi:hypothetical protein